MELSEELRKRRTELLTYVSISLGTIKSAVSGVNTCEGIAGCEKNEETYRDVAKEYIDVMIKDLKFLQSTL